MRGERAMNGMCAASAALIVLATIIPVHTQAGWPKKATSSVTKLADSIDKLEMHIEQYGSVVPKQPDVWGQARLTKYRRMVEELLEKQKIEFKETINATINRSDQAMFANSLAIQAAISGPQAFVTRRGGTTVVNSTAPGASNSSSSSASTSTPTSSSAPQAITLPVAIDPKGQLDTSALSFTTTKANAQTLIPFKNAGNGVAL